MHSSDLSTVLLTREACGELRAVIEAAGALTVHVPLIERVATGHPPPKQSPRFVLVTSAAAARFGTGLAKLVGDAVVVAVGRRTAQALDDVGVPCGGVGAGGGLEAVKLLGQLGAHGGLPPETVWHVSAETVSPQLHVQLQAFGSALGRWPVYRTQIPSGTEQALANVGLFDVVTFASGSAVAAFASHGCLNEAKVAVIGPSTAQVARAHGLPVHGIAQHRTMGSLADVALSLCDQD